MSDDLTSALRDAERRLQASQLAGDADIPIAPAPAPAPQ